MSPPDDRPPYAFRDVGAVVPEVLAAHPARPGGAYLVLVREPAGAQEVEHVERIRRRRWSALDEYARSTLLGEMVDRMPVPERVTGGGPRHSVLTIVMRRGMAVLGAPEAEWLRSWRYAYSSADTYKGDLVLVTEHGWCDFMTRSGGFQPCLAA